MNISENRKIVCRFCECNTCFHYYIAVLSTVPIVFQSELNDLINLDLFFT
jgi:hypothetical protein